MKTGRLFTTWYQEVMFYGGEINIMTEFFDVGDVNLLIKS